MSDKLPLPINSDLIGKQVSDLRHPPSAIRHLIAANGFVR